MATDIKISHDLACALEESEAVYWSKYYDVNASLNCYATIVGGAFAGAMPEQDILAMNRVIGLGMYKTVKPEDIEDLIQFYRKAGSKRFFIQLSPHCIQDELREMLREKGFRHHNNWVKLLREANPPLPEPNISLKVLEIDPKDSKTYGQIIYDSFDWEDPRLADWLAIPVGKSGYRHYLALYHNQPVAAAALHVMDTYASLAFAGTLASYRGKGAQSLLIQRRLTDAARAGCRYVMAETAEPTTDNPVASYQNLRRFGFREVYRRANWLWEF